MHSESPFAAAPNPTFAGGLPGPEAQPDHELALPTDVYAAFEQFAPQVIALQNEIGNGTVNPAQYLGGGVRSDAYMLPGGTVAKLPRSGGSLPVATIVEDYVRSLSPGRGLRGVEQILAASSEVGAVISVPVVGKRLKAIGLVELSTMDEARLHGLCNLFERMAVRGLGQENPLDDTVYDVDATDPEDAFGAIDFQSGVNEPVSVFIDRFATAMTRPVDTLAAAKTEEDYATLAQEQTARLDVLKRLSAICESRYPDDFEITDRIDTLAAEGQRYLGKFQNSDWVRQRVIE